MRFLLLRRWLFAALAATAASCSDSNPFPDSGPLPDVGNTETAVDSGHDAGFADASDVVDTGAMDVAHDAPQIDAPADGYDVLMVDTHDAMLDVPADVRDGGVDVLTTDAPVDAPADVHSDAADAADGVTSPPWRHTIGIDGTNDFTAASEAFSTTSSGYSAFITWDATNLYVGYSGADVAAADMQKWLFVYLDTDPGAGTGAGMGPTYNTETPAFPAGYGAEYYFRWKTSNDFQSLEQYSVVSGSWSTVTGVTVRTGLSGTYVEFAIPLSAIGNPARVGVITLMMNETALHEAAYAGLYVGSFTDGYHPTVSIANYLRADFASSLAPNDPTNRRP